MPGSKTNSMTPDEVKRAVRKLPRSADFVWDGVDEDDRPATVAELQGARRGPGRPGLARNSRSRSGSTAICSRRCAPAVRAGRRA
jgi:hypothetical protein